MAGFDDILPFLQQKYAIMQQNADTSALGTKAAANLDTVKAGLLPNESAANVAQTRAQAGLLAEQARYLGPETLARIGLYGAQGENYRADAGLARANTTGVQQLNETLGTLTPEQRAYGALHMNGMIPAGGTVPTTYTASTPQNTSDVQRYWGGVAAPTTPSYRIPDAGAGLGLLSSAQPRKKLGVGIYRGTDLTSY